MSDITWKTHPAIRRYEGNPVLSAGDVPCDACLIFNAGVTKFQGRYVMVFRNDTGNAERKELKGGSHLGIAFSDDGIHWKAEARWLFPDPDDRMYHAYDPRLTVLDGRLYMCFACAGHGTRGGVAVTDDLQNWDVLSVTAPDNRNMVIFPERFDGKVVRLERPFAGYLRPGDRFDIWISASRDGRYWGDTALLLGTESVPWVNNKIGPGAPPVKTDRGWLCITHGVDIAEDRTWGWSGDWNKRYSAGLMLLDREDPYKVIGLSDGPVLVPEPDVPYEAEGYRGYVIFPGGMVLEDDGEVKIYYGAADTVEALALADVGDLLELCKPVYTERHK